jgi:hypothetical protein
MLVVAVTFLAVAFFILPTRVHERYLFPAFAVGAILAATSIRWRIGYFFRCHKSADRHPPIPLFHSVIVSIPQATIRATPAVRSPA